MFFSIYKQPSLWSIYNISTLTWSMMPLDLWNHIDPFTSIRTNFVRCLSLISHLRGKQIKILSGLENESLGKFKIFINLFINFSYHILWLFWLPQLLTDPPPPLYPLKLMLAPSPSFFVSLSISLFVSLPKRQIKANKDMQKYMGSLWHASCPGMWLIYVVTLFSENWFFPSQLAVTDPATTLLKESSSKMSPKDILLCS